MRSQFVQFLINGFLLLAVHVSLAQDIPNHFYRKLPAQIDDIHSIEQFIEQETGFPIKLQIFSDRQSPAGTHSSYHLYLDGYRIHQSVLQWNRYDEGYSTLSWPDLKPLTQQTSTIPSPTALQGITERYSVEQDVAMTPEVMWVIQGNGLSKQWVVRTEDEDSVSEIILDSKGDIMAETDLSTYSGPDTIVEVNLFMPDPLTSARAPYYSYMSDAFGNYDSLLADFPLEIKDQLDSTDTLFGYPNQALANQYYIDTISMTFDVSKNGYILESSVARAVDRGLPKVKPPVLLEGGQTLVNRKDTAFEFYNAYYHIHRMHYLLRELGFGDLMSEVVEFDAMGTLADQSSFSYRSTGPFLRFGIGGVDDAEDAEVVVHEYGHAVSYSASPGTNLGSQRAALDEGFGDYLATSYSSRITDYNLDKIFSWDTGEGNLWPQRELVDNRTYPTDLVFDIYEDGLLWTSALMEIAECAGLDATDRSMICSLFEWYPDMKLSDAAHLYLQADSLCNDMATYDCAAIIFCARGILPGCEDTVISELPLVDPFLTNTYDYAFNREPLYIFPNNYTINRIEIIDVKGRLLHEVTVEPYGDQRFLTFEDPGLPQGIFLMRLYTEETETFSFKIVSLWK